MSFPDVMDRELTLRDQLLAKAELALSHALGELRGTGCFSRVCSSPADKQCIEILKEIRAHNQDPT